MQLLSAPHLLNQLKTEEKMVNHKDKDLVLAKS